MAAKQHTDEKLLKNPATEVRSEQEEIDIYDRMQDGWVVEVVKSLTPNPVKKTAVPKLKQTRRSPKPPTSKTPREFPANGVMASGAPSDMQCETHLIAARSADQ